MANNFKPLTMRNHEKFLKAILLHKQGHAKQNGYKYHFNCVKSHLSEAAKPGLLNRDNVREKIQKCFFTNQLGTILWHQGLDKEQRDMLKTFGFEKELAEADAIIEAATANW